MSESIKYPSIVDVKWRVDVSISTSTVARSLTPFVVNHLICVYHNINIYIFYFVADGNYSEQWCCVDI